MGRPRQVSDEQILSVMRASVLAHGPNVPLDRVAKELQITTPALLKRFGSRQALLVAALRPPEQPAWLRILDQGPTEEPLATQLRAVFEAAFAYMGEWTPCSIALRESGIPIQSIYPNKKPAEEALRAMQRWLRRARKRGLVAIKETDTAAFVMVGALQARAFFAHVVQLEFTERAQRQYVEELSRFFERALFAGTGET
jgi:AcrR family transcriptional regulator